MTDAKPDRYVTFRGIDGDELFEEHDDIKALALLHQVEVESC